MIRILGAGAWGTALAALWAHPRTGVDAPTIELVAHTAETRLLARVVTMPRSRARALRSQSEEVGLCTFFC